MARYLIMLMSMLLCMGPRVAAVDDDAYNAIAARLNGDWVLTSWRATLLKTRSPSLAYRKAGHEITHLLFRRSAGDALRLEEVINCFHESTGERSIGDFNRIQRGGAPQYSLLAGTRETGSMGFRGKAMGGSQDESMGEVIIANDSAMSFYPDGYMTTDRQRHTYIKCRPTLSQFVNRLTIAGSYTDDGNRPYTFSENGVTTWNIVQYTYEVNLDYTLGGDDIFFLKPFDGGQILDTYGFVRSGDALLVYHVGKSDTCDALVRVGKPLMALRKRQQDKR